MVFIFYHPPHEPLACFLVQVFLTLVFTRAVGKLLGYVKQPRVVGEVVGGIILGPTVLGRIPGFTDKIFPQLNHDDLVNKSITAHDNGTVYENDIVLKSYDTFKVAANMGLILFMFLMGLELEIEMIARVWKKSVPIAVACIGVPFGLGALCSLWWIEINDEAPQEGWVRPDQIAFVLFSGTVLSFTAFPVLCAILKATKLSSTTLGALVLSCSAINDVVAWCILAVASSFSKTGSPVDGGYTTLLAVAYVVAMFVLMRPLVHYTYEKFNRSSHQGKVADSSTFACLLFLMLFLSAFTSEVIGIHAFFGAFIAGMIVPKEGDLPHLLAPKIELVVREFLLPLFFASSGIQTNLGALDTGRLWGIAIAVTVIASIAKIIPAAILTRFMVRESWRFCFTVGILMNTRGLVMLIALNVAIQYNILSELLFTIFVIMALITTAMTAPLVWWVWLKPMHPIKGGGGGFMAEVDSDHNYLTHDLAHPEERRGSFKGRGRPLSLWDGPTAIPLVDMEGTSKVDENPLSYPLGSSSHYPHDNVSAGRSSLDSNEDLTLQLEVVASSHPTENPLVSPTMDARPDEELGRPPSEVIHEELDPDHSASPMAVPEKHHVEDPVMYLGGEPVDQVSDA